MDNVIPFRQKPVIFNQELKTKLIENTRQYTDKPELAVNGIENAICSYFVEKVFVAATQIGEHLGKRITTFLERALG